ncbi:MAG: hypothetical protein QM642_10510 [Edaphocola sp.]
MKFEQKKNTKAIGWTVGVHALLLLALLLFKYKVPAQPASEDLGMEVNLGTGDNGFGTDQTEDPESPAAEASHEATANAAAQPEEAHDVHTADNEDAPAVPIRKQPKPTTVPKKVTQQQVAKKPAKTTNDAPTKHTAAQPAQQRPRYVYPGSTGKGGNSAQGSVAGGSEGTGTGNGDMGVPGGTPGAANYQGTPGGGGTSMGHNISGRTLVNRPDPKAEFREGGKVVIRVTVNREGHITDSRVVSAGNATIRALALKKLAGVKFNASPNAPAEQFGNITFNFKATR